MVGVCRIEAVVYSFYAALATFCFFAYQAALSRKVRIGVLPKHQRDPGVCVARMRPTPSVCRRRRVLRPAVARMQIKTNFYSLRPDQARAAVRQARSTGIFITYLAFTIRIPTPWPGLPDFYGVPGI